MRSDEPWVVLHPGDKGLFLSVDRYRACFLSRMARGLLGFGGRGRVEVCVSPELDVLRLRATDGGVGFFPASPTIPSISFLVTPCDCRNAISSLALSLTRAAVYSRKRRLDISTGLDGWISFNVIPLCSNR